MGGAGDRPFGSTCCPRLVSRLTEFSRHPNEGCAGSRDHKTHETGTPARGHEPDGSIAGQSASVACSQRQTTPEPQRGEMKLDSTRNLAKHVSEGSPSHGDPDSAATEPRSPFRSTSAKWSWGLMAVFTAIYFVVAILTSKEAADLAATMILGLPLGFILGIGMIIAGLVITGVYLNKVKG